MTNIDKSGGKEPLFLAHVENKLRLQLEKILIDVNI